MSEWTLQGEPRCRNVVGPVWKLDGESWACVLPEGHDGEHASSDGLWWVQGVGNALSEGKNE